MTIRAKKQPTELVIDLTGPAGNAFSLMGQATRFARQLKLGPRMTLEILTEMKSGDYENLVDVFDKHFGDYVVLER